MLPAPKYLTVKHCCERYDVGRTKLWWTISQGLVEAVKFGARTLVVVESADAYFASLPPARRNGRRPSPGPSTDAPSEVTLTEEKVVRS